MDDQQTHAEALRALADRFSEGWHDGIKIDASDVMDLSAAADELETLRKNAERYLWLRAGTTPLLCIRADRVGKLNNVQLTGESSDEAIDAAMALHA